MPALSPGWVDTGLTYTHTFTLSAALRAIGSYGYLLLNLGNHQFELYTAGTGAGLACGAGTFGQEINSGGAFAGTDAQLWLDRPAGADVLLQTVTGTTCAPGWFADVAVSGSAGPYRLGYTLEIDDSGNRNAHYALFADTATTISLTVGGHTASDAPYASPTIVYSGAVMRFGFRHNSLQVPASTAEYAFRFSGMQVNGDTMSTGGFTAGQFIETSTGVIQAKQYNSGPFAGTWQNYGPCFHFRIDAAVADSNGVSLPATIEASRPAGTVLTCPYVGTHSVENWNGAWNGQQSVSITSAYASSLSPTLPAAERAMLLRGQNPKAPGTVPKLYTPIAISRAASATVMYSGNSWAGAGGVATAGAGGQDWTVTGAGSATRQLRERWSVYTTSGDPVFEAHGFKVTKRDYYSHSAGEDTWGWGSYAYLDVDITAAATGTLTLTVTGRHASFTYTSGARTGTTAKTATYTINITATGRQTKRVDLLFPATWNDATSPATSGTGGPYYHERVDSVKFEGMGNGAWTLHSLTLVAVEPAYLKWDVGANMTGATLAQDGAWPAGLWAANPFHSPTFLKDEEGYLGPNLERWGGCVPGREYTGSATLAERTLEEIAIDLNRIEGITATYSAGTIPADMSDSYGNVVGTDYELSTALPEVYRARWLHPVLPHVRVGAAAVNLTASILADTMRIPAGVGSNAAPVFTFYARQALGGVLEAQCRTTAGARSPAGVTICAVRTDTNVEVARADTDASGFVTVGVGADSSRTYRLEEL